MMKINYPKTIQELLALPEEFDQRLKIPTRGYLYHGSPNPNIIELEPRQAISHGQNDGQPAICASRNPQDSIFISLFNRSRLKDPNSGASGWRVDGDGPTTYTATKNVIEIAKRSKGYLYLLSPADFDWIALEDPIHRDRRELRSLKPIKPLAKIEVDPADFTDKIKEINLEDL